MNAPARSKNHLKRRNRSSTYMKDPGLHDGGPPGERTTIEDIDMDAINRTVAFSDWYEAVLATSPAAKSRR